MSTRVFLGIALLSGVYSLIENIFKEDEEGPVSLWHIPVKPDMSQEDRVAPETRTNLKILLGMHSHDFTYHNICGRESYRLELQKGLELDIELSMDSGSYYWHLTSFKDTWLECPNPTAPDFVAKMDMLITKYQHIPNIPR